ncbi:dipeptidase [Micromonospora sp. NBC_00858]|uniref:dipeptidase n=1 Tax=Micromonospora sp. NBC_00858 TaxID=2975979 RepID=UPI003866B209|nr:dipeptidase [Micromonospora sp. NBC_00858]
MSYEGYRAFSYLRPGVDYREIELAPTFGRMPPYDLGLDPRQAERAARLLRDNIVISLHEHPQNFPADMTRLGEYNRAGRQFTSYEGLAASGLTAVFDNMMNGTGCVISHTGWSWEDTIYDIGMRLADLAKQSYAHVVHDLADIERAHRDGTIGIVLSLEAATPIENQVDRIDILYGLGIRQMGIAYSEANALGGGLKERNDGGLTAFGRRAVERMNRLGIAIDISHSGDRTCLDTITESSAPVLITHAGARSVWPTSRMKPDEVLVACAERGGLIGIEAAPHTTISPDHPRHDIDSVMDHFRYCVDLMGIEHVTFGPDTLYGDHVALHRELAKSPGFSDPPLVAPFEPVEYVAGVENPTEGLANIIGWLVRQGYSDADIQAVTGGNILRVLKQIW